MNNEIHFYTHGQGHPIIFIHSLGLDHNLWNFCIEELSTVAQTLTYDLPGHGINPPPEYPYNIEDLSSDLIKALKRNKISKASFVGLSIGGMVAQHLAAHNPDVIEKLILIDTTTKYSQEWKKNWAQRASIARSQGVSTMKEKLLEAFFTPDFLSHNSSEIKYCRSVINSMSDEGYAIACEALALANTEDYAALIDSDTLIMCGSEDNILFKEAVSWLDENIKKTQVEWLSPAQHVSPLERQEDFIKHLRAFLKI